MLDSLSAAFSFGKNELTAEVSLVQKKDKVYDKDLFDRIIGFMPTDHS